MSNTEGQKPPSHYQGGSITFNAPGATTIGSSSTAGVAANPNRKYLAVCNDSDETMYLSFTEDAEMNKGIRLNANGGTLEWIGPGIFQEVLNAICASGSKTLTYQEGE